MNIASQYADVYTDFQGLAELRAEAGSNKQETLRKVAGQFEALFIQMMLKSMRDANLGEGLMDSEHVKTYQSMFDQQIALDLSKSNRLGLADMMVRQLSRNGETGNGELPPGEGSAGAVTPAAALNPPQRASAAIALHPVTLDGIARRTTGAESKQDWTPDSPESFVKALLPHAQRAANELGTRPQVLIAQAALETGWGKHMIRGGDGVNSFNLFGIKADARWQGERAVTDTVEFRDGLMRKERASFRAYDSLADSFADYVAFLKGNPRYREALNRAADAPAFARALSEAGYATDPEYSKKINRIMHSEPLRDMVSGIKETDRGPLS